jgi:hypothetical protein
MSLLRISWLRWATAFLTAFIFLAQAPQPSYAKARLVAVIMLRSTPALRPAALKATKALAMRISQEEGWDARVVDAHGRAPADAAANVGAQIYVIGQYTGGSPGRVVGAAIRVATDEHLGDFSYAVSSTGSIPNSVAFSQLIGASPNISAAPKPTVSAISTSIPSGDLLSVAILSDIGSRISQEGDTFGVITTEDYYYQGHLILPKGSPGYGVITHLKRAGSFHAGGELNFTVKRLVTPARTDLLVETDGATADADKQTEKNGNTFGQYLLWGVGMFAQRGNDILIKKGTTFHVSTVSNATVPIAQLNALPAPLDPVVQLNATGQLPTPQAAAQAQPIVPSAAQAGPQATSAPGFSGQDNAVAKGQNVATTLSLLRSPNSWIEEKRNDGSDGMRTLGYWVPPGSNAGEEWLSVASQGIPVGLAPEQFAAITRQNLERSIGEQNVHIFRPDRICNGTQNGWYAESVAAVGLTRVVAEQTIGVAGNDSYIATYSRPEGSVEDADARRALYSLCALNKN